MKWKNFIMIVGLILLIKPLYSQNHLIISRSERLPQEGGVFQLAERILSEAYSRLGIQIEFKAFPAERALWSANNGIVDANLQRTAGIEQQYHNLIMVPFPLTKSDIMVFTKNKSFQVKGYNSLKAYSICILSSFKATEIGTKEMPVTIVSSLEQAFKMLDANRIDIFIFPREGICTAKNLALTTIKVLEPPVEQNPAYHYLNKRHSDLVPRLAAVLKSMEKEGITQRLQQESLKELKKMCY